MRMSKSGLLPIEQRVKNILDQTFQEKDPPILVIGVSGGADSMCLMHILNKLGAKLHAVHINYKKRGEAANKDAELVEHVARKLKISYKVIELNPAQAKGKNFQQWARKIRYDVFETVQSKINARGIAVAHHKNDQIETILQKLFRGGGLISWSAMQAWDGGLFRPLIGVSREEIEIYCRENGIPFRTDASNLDSDYARNFLRNEWVPQIEEHFPGWQTNVLRIAEQGKIFESSLDYILQNITDDKDRIHRIAFLQLDEALQKSVLLYYIKRVDATKEVSRHALKELSKLADLQTGKSIQLASHLSLMRDREYLKLVIETGDSGSFLMLEKGDLKGGGIAFNGFKFELKPFENPDFKKALYLDAGLISWPARLRRWREGDRFQPFGMEGHQTVADHLTNRKVSAASKEKALVVESFEETICAVIFPPIENRRPPGTISELVKCDSSIRKCLTINKIS